MEEEEERKASGGGKGFRGSKVSKGPKPPTGPNPYSGCWDSRNGPKPIIGPSGSLGGSARSYLSTGSAVSLLEELVGGEGGSEGVPVSLWLDGEDKRVWDGVASTAPQSTVFSGISTTSANDSIPIIGPNFSIDDLIRSSLRIYSGSWGIEDGDMRSGRVPGPL